MGSKVIPFGFPRPEAEALIHSLATAGKYVMEPHSIEGMNKRGISMRQAMLTLESGCINQGPDLDDYGDWRCRLRKRTAGRLVRVVCAIHDRRILYVISVH